MDDRTALTRVAGGQALRRVALWLCLGALGAPTVSSAAPASPRQVLSGDFDWRFALGDPAGAEAPGFDDSAWRAVQLPHDWSIESPPDPKGPTGNGEGYYPAGIGWYRRAFSAPAAWKRKHVTVEFDGIHRNASIYLNGTALGTRPSGYSSVAYDLTPHLVYGARNVLAVRVDNSAQPNSRWYSGSGIYRHVRVVVTSAVHVAHWGVVVTTPEITPASSEVVVRTKVDNDTGAPADVSVETAVVGPTGVTVGTTRSPVAVKDGGAEVAQVVTVANPALWAPATPRLYTAVTRVLQQGAVVDEVETPFGIRSIDWSVEKGLLLNGEPILLAGGSVHHDNGPLGAAAFDRAEERRVEVLKAAGFNAVRTAHNVPSPAFLDACDRLGLLVLDEPFDVWKTAKVKYDMASEFDAWWQRDLDAMVLRDRNHPSVVMWGIGNEIPEAWTPEGGPLGKQISARVRSLDDTRPITQAFPGATFGPNPDATIANVDVAGYNYNLAQNHVKDHARVPSRLMMTTESFPRDVFEQWQLVHDTPYIIGEFVWTAMDYLGESGIGGWRFGTPERAAQVDGFLKMVKPGFAAMGADGKNPFQVTEKAEDPSTNPMMSMLFVGRPYHAAACGDIDLTGGRKPQSYYRDILWNGGDRVYAAVRVPAPDGQTVVPTVWSVVPTVHSWSWPGHEGKDLSVEVYAGTEKVRLLLNDAVVGEQPTGRAQQFRALFTVPYATGTLKVVGLNGDRVVAQDVLETAGPARRLRLTVDRPTLHADGQDLAFVAVEAIDALGRPQPTADQEVTVALTGPGAIAAVGNADQTSDEPYVGTSYRLFQGRALIVVRASRQAGSLTLNVHAEGLEPTSATIATRPGSTVPLLPR
jgi:beta-galactosidase